MNVIKKLFPFPFAIPGKARKDLWKVKEIIDLIIEQEEIYRKHTVDVRRINGHDKIQS